MKVPFPFVSFLIASTLLVLIYAAPIIAAECGPVPTNSCTVSQNTIFNPGTYSLPNGILIVANNLILNCNGATLNGSKTSGGSGIKLQSTATNSIVIANCKIKNYYMHGIHSETNLTNSLILNNQITNNTQGGIRIIDEGDTPTISSNNIIRGNTIVQNGIANLYAGVDMAYANNNIIENNVIESTGIGVRIIVGKNNNLTLNSLRYQDRAINIEGDGNPGTAMGNAIQENIIESNTVGILLNDEATNTLIMSNIIDFNAQVGIHLRMSSNNEVRDNLIANSAGKGMIVGMPQISNASRQNLIHRNNFITNADYAHDYSTSNNWNASDIGNFWLEFSQASQGCTDNNVDNICDVPYDINSGGGFTGGEGNTPLDYLPRTGLFSGVPPPTLEHIEDIAVDEGNDIVIAVNASGGVPPLTYFVIHPLFVNNSNILTWQTNFTDADTYGAGVVTVVVQDSTNIKAAQNMTLTINDVANTECSAATRNSCTVSASTTLPANQLYNFRDGIRIAGNNLILDCAGSTFDGSGFPYIDDGMKLEGRTGVTIQNCNVQKYDNGINMISSTNALLSNINLLLNKIGIDLESSSSNHMQNLNVVGPGTPINTPYYGIRIIGGNGNTIEGSTIQTEAAAGIIIENSPNNNILSTSISDVPNGNALWIRFSNGNVVDGNTFQTSINGIWLYSSGQTNIKNNSFVQNHKGIVISGGGSNNNQFYHNNFIENSIQAQDFGSSNIWDINSEGNYWSDYQTPSQGCNDNNLNGLCDAPKTFPFNQDNFPFTNLDGWINSWPIFTSTPVTTAQDGSLYTYDVDAVDPNNDPMTFSLLTAPSGMTIDSSTGVITWTAHGTWSLSPPTSFPTPYGRGKAQQLIAAPVPIVVEARDSNGGARTQSWQIEMSPGTSNACPAGVPC